METTTDALKKKQIVIKGYPYSGVKTGNWFGVFFMVIGVLAVITTAIGFIMYLIASGSRYGEEDAILGLSLASTFFPISIGSFASSAICLCVSTIARTALYQRTLLEETYDFVEYK